MKVLPLLEIDLAEAESLDLGDFEVGTPEVVAADDMLDLVISKSLPRSRSWGT